MTIRPLVVAAFCACTLAKGEPTLPVAYRIPAARADAVDTLVPSAVQLHGWLGARIDANIAGRLEVVDTEPLLAGFEKKPGEHPWIGEHVGKWLHAATLAWSYSGDPSLREKLDKVAERLIAAQEPDGYLGTYLPAQRFGLYPGADWDVWSHKYCMIGLLTYYRYTGNKAALQAAERAGDLLIRTFPAKKSIISAGTHEGMAATSVLEPMVQLYRLAGDARYLAFCRYIVGAYDDPGGPAIVRTLLEKGDVSHTANGKAYEMLSNLVGLCELARVTGDPRLLKAVDNAWADIVANRLYITGTSSTYELFGGAHELPNGEDAHLGETCVTVTWIQLNIQLLRLTGEAKYADQIERSLYNQLTAAQNPRGDDWCYYTPLEGHKHYDKGITCCHSSGPRGLALAPTVAYLQSGSVLYVDTFETSRGRFSVGGHDVELDQTSEFPRIGHSALVVHTAAPTEFALRIRVPQWAAPLHAPGSVTVDGWAELPIRRWVDGDRVEFDYRLEGRLIHGEYTNYSRAALAWGPFILAVDSTLNPRVDSLGGIRLTPSACPTLVGEAPALRFTATAFWNWDFSKWRVNLIPFADAGANGEEYRVWLRAGS